jgi:PAS domain S-box-containing protein
MTPLPMMSALKRLLLIAMVSCVPLPCVHAIGLTSVDQIIALDALDAGKNPRPVKLTGTVVDAGTDQPVFSLHDGRHTTGVTLPAGLPMPKLGSTVEVSGVSYTFLLDGRAFPRVKANTLIVTGQGELPPMPEATPAVEINSMRSFDQWLSVEGHVARWKYRSTDHELVIVVVDASGFTTIAVRMSGRDSVPQGLMGSRLRATGVNFNKNTLGAFGSMMIPSPDQVQILAKGNDSDPYAFPITSAADISAGKIPVGSRVKVRGIVLGRQSANEVNLRDGSHALRNLLFPPWAGNLPYEEYHDGGPWPAMKPGDVVEMIGFLTDENLSPHFRGYSLNHCYARTVGTNTPPAPVPTSLKEISDGRHAHDLVQIRARLASIHQISSRSDLWRTTMMLESDGRSIPLILENPAFINMESLRVDDDLMVTAFVNQESAREPRQLLCRSFGDVKSLGLSPSVRSRQIRLYGTGIILLLALLSVWIILLRRSNRQKSLINARIIAAHDKARASEQRWKLLFEQSPLSVQIFSPDGQTIRFNQAWKNLFQRSDEEAYAFNVLHAKEMIHSGALEHIRKAFQGEVAHIPPMPFHIPGNPPEKRWIGAVLYPLHQTDGTIAEVVTVYHDITESKRAAEALREMNAILEERVVDRTRELQDAQRELQRNLEQERELGELKSRFVTTVSHEFRTPLGIIMSSVELLQHYAARISPEEQERQLEQIHLSTRHMGGLMEQVLLLGRSEAGKLSFKPDSLAIIPFATRILDEIRSVTHERCAMLLQHEGDLGGAVADEALLRHILTNLLSNAVKYSPDGAPILLNIHRQEQSLVFQVIDQGIGIPEKDHPHLFEAFHRCSNVTDQSGTGLGLVIVKRCVELHGGTISFQSTPGQGTTFTVTIHVFRESDDQQS